MARRKSKSQKTELCSCATCGSFIPMLRVDQCWHGELARYSQLPGTDLQFAYEFTCADDLRCTEHRGRAARALAPRTLVQ
jgi:hypothetical protein